MSYVFLRVCFPPDHGALLMAHLAAPPTIRACRWVFALRTQEYIIKILSDFQSSRELADTDKSKKNGDETYDTTVRYGIIQTVETNKRTDNTTR